MIPRSPDSTDEKETGRLEAFSDGVFSIAMTLLVLELKVPHGDPGHLVSELLSQGATYVAFATSFFNILIMWINHHALFKQVGRVDHSLLVLNGLLLFGVTFVPFPTELVSEAVGFEDQRIAALVYTGTLIFIAIIFNLLWRYASTRLLSAKADPKIIDAINKQYRFGPLFYVLAFGLAFVNFTASIGICVGLAIFFALPKKTSIEGLE